MFKNLYSLIFPQTCVGCNTSLLSNEQYLCSTCKSSLPKTDDNSNTENGLLSKFGYEPMIKTAAAFLFFTKGGITQKLLHQLKYLGQKELGFLLGKWFGREMELESPDLIIPVPIHSSKKRSRGYNQSDSIAEGIGESFPEAQVRTDLITRTKKVSSQTNKSKVERWSNMTNVYSDINEDLSGNSVLVVDDVVTTGATIGMLCDKLREAGADRIHIATLARR